MVSDRFRCLARRFSARNASSLSGSGASGSGSGSGRSGSAHSCSVSCRRGFFRAWRRAVSSRSRSRRVSGSSKIPSSFSASTASTVSYMTFFSDTRSGGSSSSGSGAGGT